MVCVIPSLFVGDAQSCALGYVADSAGAISNDSLMSAQGDTRASTPEASGRCRTLSRLSVRYWVSMRARFLPGESSRRSTSSSLKPRLTRYV